MCGTTTTKHEEYYIEALVKHKLNLLTYIGDTQFTNRVTARPRFKRFQGDNVCAGVNIP